MNKEDDKKAATWGPVSHETVGGSMVRLTGLMPTRAVLEIVRPNNEIYRGSPPSLFTGIDRGDARDIILTLEAWLKSDAPDDSVTAVDLADEVFARELVRRLNHRIESCESMRTMCDRALNEEGRWAPWMLGFVSTTLGSDQTIGLVHGPGGEFCGFELLRGGVASREAVPGTSPGERPAATDHLAVRVETLERALEDLRLAKNREVETLEGLVHGLDERLSDVEGETCDTHLVSCAAARRATSDGRDDEVFLGTVLENIIARLEDLEIAADDASAEVKYKPEKKEKEERVVTGWLWKHAAPCTNPYGGENGWKGSVKAASPFRTRVAAREFADRHGDVRNNILAGYTKLVPVTRKKKGGGK
jgi:hypothetical protein